jgi:tetratricopeptide (TPR) repeat protein
VQRYDRLIDPSNPDSLALYRRAVALDASGQTDKAMEDYSAAIKADPKSSLAFLGRGVLLAVRKRAYDRAVEDFDKVLVIEPDNVEALVSRGDAFGQLGDPALALNEYNAALRIDPNRALSLYGRGLARIRTGDAAGKGDQAAALTINPEVADDFSIYGLK